MDRRYLYVAAFKRSLLAFAAVFALTLLVFGLPWPAAALFALIAAGAAMG